MIMVIRKEKTFGEKLEAFRLANQLTYGQLSQKTGVPLQTLQALCTKGRNPARLTIAKITAAITL